MDTMNDVLERLDRIEAMLEKALGQPDFITVAQFAKEVGMHPKYVSRLCKEGRIPAIRSAKGRGLNQEWRIQTTEVKRFKER